MNKTNNNIFSLILKCIKYKIKENIFKLCVKCALFIFAIDLKTNFLNLEIQSHGILSIFISLVLHHH